MTISGQAAGVRYLAVPPADEAADAPVVARTVEAFPAAFRPELRAPHEALPGSRPVTVPGLEHPIPAGDTAVDREVSAWLA